MFSSWRELPRKVHLAWITLHCGPLKVDRFAWISACNAMHNVSIVELLWKYFFSRDRILSLKKFALFQTVLYSCCDHCAKMGWSDLFCKKHRRLFDTETCGSNMLKILVCPGPSLFFCFFADVHLKMWLPRGFRSRKGNWTWTKLCETNQGLGSGASEAISGCRKVGNCSVVLKKKSKKRLFALSDLELR